jgi:hypothetical protein
MTKSIQTEAFGRSEGSWVLCIHCERAYQVGQFRLIDDLEYCPYPGCNGDTFFDSFEWEIVKKAHPEYPDVPDKEKVYRLN